MDILFFIGGLILFIGFAKSAISFDKISFNLIFLGLGVAFLAPSFREAFRMLFNPENKPIPDWYMYSVDGVLWLGAILFIVSSVINMYLQNKKESNTKNRSQN